MRKIGEIEDFTLENDSQEGKHVLVPVTNPERTSEIFQHLDILKPSLSIKGLVPFQVPVG
jgi:hypothetical protein